MTAKRAPRRPMIASLSAEGSKIARCAVSATSAHVFSIKATRLPSSRIRTGVGNHPQLGVPGGRLQLIRRGQLRDFVRLQRRREPTLGVSHSSQDGRRVVCAKAPEWLLVYPWSRLSCRAEVPSITAIVSKNTPIIHRAVRTPATQDPHNKRTRLCGRPGRGDPVHPAWYIRPCRCSSRSAIVDLWRCRTYRQ